MVGIETMAATEPPRRPSAAGIDTEYLELLHQYKDPTNLHARVALHAKHTVAEQPWFRVGGRPTRVATRRRRLGGRLRIRVALGEYRAAAARAAAHADRHFGGDARRRHGGGRILGNVELVEARTADAQELPFDDDSFDVVVANHMLYHVPDRPRALRELARILHTDGVLMAATNGARHLEQVSKASREVFGSSTMDFVDRRFGRSTGGGLLNVSFADVEWQSDPSALACDEPEDVYNFIASSSSMQQATRQQDPGTPRRHQADVQRAGRQIGDRHGLLPGEATASLRGRRRRRPGRSAKRKRRRQTVVGRAPSCIASLYRWLSAAPGTGAELDRTLVRRRPPPHPAVRRVPPPAKRR